MSFWSQTATARGGRDCERVTTSLALTTRVSIAISRELAIYPLPSPFGPPSSFVRTPNIYCLSAVFTAHPPVKCESE